MPALTLSHGMKLYNISEVTDWWARRTEQRWQERRRRGFSRSIQMNVRIDPDSLAMLDQLRSAGETRSAAARRVLIAALHTARDNGE